MRSVTIQLAIGICALLAITGCIPRADREVIVYCALDREFSEPILESYEDSEGVTVLPKYDVESTKTVGLVTALISEKNRPRCDVFWNNEILHTLRLEKQGLLDVYRPAIAAEFPSAYRSPNGQWHGLAARARVLIVNTELLPNRDDWPDSVMDLADSQWSGKCAMAKPLFGTTATHAAVLHALWGQEQFEEYYRRVNANAAVMSGNKQVAIAVARGDYAFGITDTDDAIIEIEKGAPVEIVYPDQSDDGLGTLFIPNTICIMKDCPNRAEAMRLIDYLLSPEVETRLAQGASAQFPISQAVDEESRVAPDHSIRWMEPDFRVAAETWDEASRFLHGLFQTADP